MPQDVTGGQQGAPPPGIDPSQMGAMPPGAPSGMDPSQMGAPSAPPPPPGMPPELLESIMGALEDMGRAIQELQQGIEQLRQETEQGLEQLQQQVAQAAQPPLADPSMMGGQGDPDANAQMGEGQPQKIW